MDITQYVLIAFDVDGTLVETKSGKDFRQEAADWQWLPGRLEKIRELRKAGVRVAICSNQGGVAFGYMPEGAVMRELHNMAKEANIALGGVYICFTHPKATIERLRWDDHRRKPGPGMIEEAMRDFEAYEDETLFVGDRPEDEQAAKAAKCDFMWAKDFFEGV